MEFITEKNPEILYVIDRDATIGEERLGERSFCGFCSEEGLWKWRDMQIFFVEPQVNPAKPQLNHVEPQVNPAKPQLNHVDPQVIS